MNKENTSTILVKPKWNPYMDDCAEAFERGYQSGYNAASVRIVQTYSKPLRKATIAECKQLVREMIFNGNPSTQTYKQALDDVLTALENMK